MLLLSVAELIGAQFIQPVAARTLSYSVLCATALMGWRGYLL
jgi:hypothetical protein